MHLFFFPLCIYRKLSFWVQGRMVMILFIEKLVITLERVESPESVLSWYIL